MADKKPKIHKNHVARSPYEPGYKPPAKVPTGDKNPRHSRAGTRKDDQAKAGEQKAPAKKAAAKKDK